MLDKLDSIIKLVTEHTAQRAAQLVAFQAEQRACNKVVLEKLARIEADVNAIKGSVLPKQ